MTSILNDSFSSEVVRYHSCNRHSAVPFHVLKSEKGEYLDSSLPIECQVTPYRSVFLKTSKGYLEIKPLTNDKTVPSLKRSQKVYSIYSVTFVGKYKRFTTKTKLRGRISLANIDLFLNLHEYFSSGNLFKNAALWQENARSLGSCYTTKNKELYDNILYSHYFR